MPEFERLLLFKALRPDRLTAAMRAFVAGALGREYTTSQPFSLEVSCQVRVALAQLVPGIEHNLWVPSVVVSAAEQAEPGMQNSMNRNLKIADFLVFDSMQAFLAI